MIKVALIHPPKEKGVVSYAPQVKASEEGIGFKPPLGLLSIGTYLKQKLGNSVQIKIIDCPAQQLTISKCSQSVIEWQPDIVGISAWSEFWYPAFNVGKMIKEQLSSCKILYGGPHVVIYPEITLNIPHVDAVILGDGEVPFYDFVKRVLEKNDSFLSKEGLHFKRSGINFESLFYIEKDLDSLPLPDRILIDMGKYSSLLFKGRNSATMITSRGCPYSCIFCKLNFQKPVCNSSQRVIEEFKYLYGLGIRELEVYDDTFTWSGQRVQDICEGILKEKIKIQWSIRDRVNLCNPELLKLLRQAGCVRIHYGIESGVQRILKIMKKGITLEQARAAVNAAKKLGFEVVTHYMLGNLDETIEDMNQTIKFALGLPSDYASFGVTIPYPGTALYETALKRGIISYDYWQAYAKNPVPDFIIPQLIENLCNREILLKIEKTALRKFYLRPGYIYRQIRKISSREEFMRKSKMASGIFLKH